MLMLIGRKKKKTEHAKKLSGIQAGENNPMYGKSVYTIWVEKYGNEIAEQKLKEFKEKQSKNSSGKNNPMYGKPSPIGSGNGWNGYYKGYYFRSLLELFYLKHLLDNNIRFESGELKKYFINYKFEGADRTYRPDYYLIDSQETIEIKPKKLINTYENKAKFEAAINKLGIKFKVLTEQDIPGLSINEIYELIVIGDIIFHKNCIDKVKNYIKKAGLEIE